MNDIFFKDLIGKNCLITGGYGTIGKSLAKGLASIGANIAILGRNKEKAEKFSSDLINEYNIRSIGVKADVINKETLISAKNEINDKLGKINILINCAGGNLPEATTKIAFFDNNMDISLSIFGLNIKCMYDVFDLNFMGTLLPIIIFGKDFIELQKGVILNVSSISSFRPLTKIPAYSAAKASVNNLTQYLAVHFSKANIRVNAIAPGFFLTEQNRYLLIDNDTNKYTERAINIINNTPLNRLGNTDELCGACNFLVSDLSSFITGIVLPVDGGFNAYSGV